MIWMVACVAVFAHSGDFTPIAKSCAPNGTTIAMSDEFLSQECKPFEDCEIVEINSTWERARACFPESYSSHPIVWVKTLEITLEK